MHTAEQTIHQYIEGALRHRIAILTVTVFLGITILHFNTPFQRAARQVYYQGFGWIGTYMHHEHPLHGKIGWAINRIPTISGTA